MPKKSHGFLQDSSKDTIKGTRFFTHIILWVIAFFIFIFIIWANYAELDEVTVGDGKVIPSSQIQVIQNLEGGIVKKIFVKQGDIVEPGQDETIKKQHPALVFTEIAVFEARKNERDQLKQDIKLAQEELNMTAPLVSKGAASPVEVLRLKRTVSELKGKLHAYRSKTVKRYNEAQGEYETLNEEMLAAQDRFHRTTVRSPVKGIIKQIKINTVGGVIQPGMDILEIVPLDGSLLIEAKVRPDDIGFIHPGQKAMVKISAYDFSIYGGLPGKVEQISADAIIDEQDKQQESFYLIRVRTQQNHLGSDKNPLRIIPGMQAQVDILTGRKTVMEYLLKPVLKAKQRALRER